MDFVNIPKIKMPKIKIGNQPDFWGFHEPAHDAGLKEYEIAFENADDFAEKLRYEKNFRMYAFLRCNFQFIDALHSFFCKNTIVAKRLTIATLGMNADAWGSIATLLEVGAVKQFDLILSSYFYAHNKDIIELIKTEFIDLEKKGVSCQLSVCSNHAKVILFETDDEKYFVFHGSANASSTDNIEQVMFEENKQLYDFNCRFFDNIINYFYTNKSVNELRGKKAWEIAKGNW